MARDLAVAPGTLRRYLDILQALHIVFLVQPWHRNIARTLLQAPKVYFYDSGMVRGDAGACFENAVAGMLLTHVHWRQDILGADSGLHYVRTKDGAEVDFCVSENQALTHLVECKLAETRPHAALLRFAAQFPQSTAVQLVRDLRQPEFRQGVNVERAGEWLARLDA